MMFNFITKLFKNNKLKERSLGGIFDDQIEEIINSVPTRESSIQNRLDDICLKHHGELPYE